VKVQVKCHRRKVILQVKYMVTCGDLKGESVDLMLLGDPVLILLLNDLKQRRKELCFASGNAHLYAV